MLMNGRWPRAALLAMVIAFVASPIAEAGSGPMMSGPTSPAPMTSTGRSTPFGVPPGTIIIMPGDLVIPDHFDSEVDDFPDATPNPVGSPEMIDIPTPPTTTDGNTLEIPTMGRPPA